MEQLTKVAKYGCLRPIVNEPMVREQMRSALKYQNQLIALERSRRLVFRELRAKYTDLSRYEDEVALYAEELAQLRTAIKAERQSERRRVVTKALNDTAIEVSAKLRAAREALKAARTVANANPAFQEAVKEMNEREAIWRKGLRALTPTYWGSYLLVEASMKQAKMSKIDPGFRRAQGFERSSKLGEQAVEGWAGEGRIGVQLQTNMTVQELFSGQGTYLRVDPIHPDAWHSSSRAVRRKLSRTQLHIRIGSEGRAPIWAVFPLEMHRELPASAKISGATVHHRVLGTQERWHAVFTFSYESEPEPQRPGTLAIDLGWRKRPDASLRAAYWADDQGNHGELLLPAAIPAVLRHTRGLQEVQSIHFNRAHKGLCRWLKAFPAEKLPPFLAEVAPHLIHWRSSSRLRRFVLEVWRHHRFDGDDAIYGIMERFAHRSRHLYQYERNEVEKVLNRRKVEYRCIAAGLARNYGTVIFENFDLNKVRRLEAPESDKADAPRAQRGQLIAAAPGELRSAIMNAVNREGGLVVQLDAAGTTSHCHDCGGVCDWDQGEELWHRCEHCGALWDQDHNAAINLLRLFRRERSGATKTPAPARKVSRGPKNKDTSHAVTDNLTP